MSIQIPTLTGGQTENPQPSSTPRAMSGFIIEQDPPPSDFYQNSPPLRRWSILKTASRHIYPALQT